MKLELNKIYFKANSYNISEFIVVDIEYIDELQENRYRLEGVGDSFIWKDSLYDSDIEWEVSKGGLCDNRADASRKMIERFESHIHDKEKQIESYKESILFYEKELAK